MKIPLLIEKKRSCTFLSKGHGGPEAANFVKKKLVENIVRHKAFGNNIFGVKKVSFLFNLKKSARSECVHETN